MSNERMNEMWSKASENGNQQHIKTICGINKERRYIDPPWVRVCVCLTKRGREKKRERERKDGHSHCMTSSSLLLWSDWYCGY